MNTVAVIDIGSNTIKNLVAASTQAIHEVAPLFQQTLEVRLSQGMAADGSLNPDAMQAACDAICTLQSSAKAYAPQALFAVATSAVREAPNRALFLEKVRAICGIEVRVLTGEEEAALVARGVGTEPSLAQAHSFTIADLGGGSLECVQICQNRIAHAESFPLGAVRLTKRFIEDPSEKIPAAVRAHIIALVRAHIRLSADAQTSLVGTGGAFNVARAILHKDSDFSRAAHLERAALENLYQALSERTAAERVADFPALSPARADIMPTALCVILEVMHLFDAKTVLNTLRNLRYGVAAACFANEWDT